MQQPEILQYLKTVQNYYREMTGKGVVLSSMDIQFLIQCRTHGISTEELRLSIRRYISKKHQLPRHIAHCARFLERNLDHLPPLSKPQVRHDPPTHTQTTLLMPESEDPVLEWIDTIEIALKTPSLLNKHGASISHINEIFAFLASQKQQRQEDLRNPPENQDPDTLTSVQHRILDLLWHKLPACSRTSIEEKVTLKVPRHASPEAKEVFKQARRRVELLNALESHHH